MVSVGLDYLALDRDASSISGGEAQRLRLVRALGAPLTGVCYVLDEPTIGLHPKDHSQLMETLRRLRDDRNTVVVVEHDEETIRAADFVVDVGPEGGAKGGYIVSQGTVQELESCAESATGRALLKRRLAPPSGLVMERKKLAAQYLTIKDASINNLQKISVKIPLGQLTVVAGVSGAGKSSLVHGTLVAKIIEEFEGKSRKQNIRPGAVGNTSSLKRIIEIDQSPIGRTPASIPLSYLGVLDEIRKVYALVPEAKMAGWGPSRFSFNSKGGRCEACGGRGYLSIPMSFLPNATVNCETCNGMRYNEATLEVRYQGFSIGELLCMTFDEATALFSNHRKIKRVLNYVQQLGLGYLTVGQPSSTLSGGEAQRLKIATELGSTDSQDTLYVLDEPTTGLHMTDVDKLMGVLSELTKKGNTVVLIEHNLDVLRVADYLIELGPGPGKKGGRVVFEGPPWKMQAGKNTSSTKEYLFPDALNHHRSQVVANSGA